MLLGLPVWLAPAYLLLFTLAPARKVRFVAGAVLAAALTFLYLVTVGLLSGPGLPMWTEGLFLWGPTTLVVSGAAFVADRWSGAPATARPEGGWALVAVFMVLSFCCGGCVLTPAAHMVDIPIDSPMPGVVMPLPSDLRLISADRDCGSETCSDLYVIDSPDGAGRAELTNRLRAHLEGTKGFELREDGFWCQRSGWFVQAEFCAAMFPDPAGSDSKVNMHVS